MKSAELLILSAIRTPLGGFQGDLLACTAPRLGAAAIAAAVERAGVEADRVGEAVMGCVLPAGVGQAPARQAARFAGLPDSVPATTVNKVCGSGMKAIMIAADQLELGRVDIAVAGGMESMSNAPYLLPKARGGYRLGHGEVKDHMFLDGLEDAYENRLMGTYADDAARHYHFTREQQDAYATQSLMRAKRAQADGSFTDEIVAVKVSIRGGEVEITLDEQPRKADPAKIPTLKPAFAKDGTVTAANSSSISDGAAALVLALAGWKAGEVDLFEINEAFANVAMIAMRDLSLPHEKVNVNGGACALGHPIGASGARIVATLLNALKRRKLKRGVASLCIGGGEATALAVEML